MYWMKVGLMVLVALLVGLWVGHQVWSRPPRVLPVPSRPTLVHTASPVAGGGGHHVIVGRGDESLHGNEVASGGLDPSTLTAHDVTLFTVFTPEEHTEPDPKPLKKGAKPPQETHHVALRAMYSWVRLLPSAAQVHVYVKRWEHCAPLRSLGVTCRVTSCWEDEFDAPRLTCLLQEANSRATTPLMLYVDDHLILFDDLLPTLYHVSVLPRFLMMGRSAPLSLQLDDTQDLPGWQRDLEAAIFLDSSNEQDSDLLGQVVLEGKDPNKGADSKSLHYMAYRRSSLDLTPIPSTMLMDTGSFRGHGWESSFLAAVLVADEGNTHVVDSSSSVTAVEFAHPDPIGSNRTSMLNELNEGISANFTRLAELRPSKKQQAFLEHLALGRLENAHYVLTGRCPTCALKENREADLPLILLRKANEHKQVVVVATNADLLALTFNWVCRARSIGVDNFVLLAEDRVSYRILRKMDLAVVLRKDAPYRKGVAAVGSREFQETLYLRALFFQQVVGLGFSLVSSHLDAIWMADPQPFMMRSAMEQGCDMWVQMEKKGKSSGGILAVLGTPVGQSFTQDYLQCEQENWNFINLHGKPRFSYSDDTDLDCVELISSRLMRRNNLKRCVLDPLLFVSEKTFFQQHAPQRSAVWPYMVHLNAARGVTNKTKVFMEWNLWAVDDEAMGAQYHHDEEEEGEEEPAPKLADSHTHGVLKCIEPPRALPPPSSEALSVHLKDVHVLLQVLCDLDVKSVELTLLSLAAARYDRGTRVDVRLTLQQPLYPSVAASKSYLKIRSLLQKFEWTHGSKTIMLLDEFVGVSDKWIDHWGLTADNEAFVLALEAGQVLSPYWLLWTRQALQHYYFDPFSYDPQLMGMSLMHQLLIMGESPSQRYGSRIPSQLLETAERERKERKVRELKEELGLHQNQTLPAHLINSTTSTLPTHHLYLYQYTPLTGTLFFPRHLHTFLQWYLLQNSSDPHVACVPTLISNQWWQSAEGPTKHWSVWLTRFVFEAGWYSLYTNFHHTPVAATPTEDGKPAPTTPPMPQGPRALMVDDQPTAGSLSISLLKHLTPMELHFPPRQELDLFDLHFKPFRLPASSLRRRKFQFPPHPTSSVSMSHVSTLEHLMHAHGHMVVDDGEVGVWEAIRPSSTILAEADAMGGERAAAHRRLAAEEAEQEGELDPDTASHEDLSHLDVMIQSMIRQMEARGPGSASRKEEHDRAKALKVHHHARSTKASLTKSIYGVINFDRCYTIDQAQEEATASECKDCFTLHANLQMHLLRRLEDRRMQQESAHRAAVEEALATGAPIPVSTLPPPDADPLAAYTSLSAEELYNLMYTLAFPRFPQVGDTEFDRLNGVKFVLYQPIKAASFDSHLRGIYFSFLLALLSNRILLIDLPDLHALYDCPFSLDPHMLEAGVNITSLDPPIWNYRLMKHRLGHLKTDEFDNKRSAELRTLTIDQLYAKPLLIHREGVTHDRVLFKNVKYKSHAAALFGSSSRMRRTGAIIKLLLSKPRAHYMATVANTQRELGLVGASLVSRPTAKNQLRTLAVHVVVPSSHLGKAITAAEPLPGVPPRHWDCVRSMILSQPSLQPEDSVIYFSTNRPSPLALQLAAQELGRFGRVVTHPLSFDMNVTTGGMSNANTTSSIGGMDPLTNQPLIDPTLISAYILGEVDLSISSGTTYGIFHAARTGFAHQAYIVKLAPPRKPDATGPVEEDYCGPMHRLDLAMQEDITF